MNREAGGPADRDNGPQRPDPDAGPEHDLTHGEHTEPLAAPHGLPLAAPVGQTAADSELEPVHRTLMSTVWPGRHPLHGLANDPRLPIWITRGLLALVVGATVLIW